MSRIFMQKIVYVCSTFKFVQILKSEIFCDVPFGVAAFIIFVVKASYVLKIGAVHYQKMAESSFLYFAVGNIL